MIPAQFASGQEEEGGGRYGQHSGSGTLEMILGSAACSPAVFSSDPLRDECSHAHTSGCTNQSNKSAHLGLNKNVHISLCI